MVSKWYAKAGTGDRVRLAHALLGVDLEDCFHDRQPAASFPLVIHVNACWPRILSFQDFCCTEVPPPSLLGAYPAFFCSLLGIGLVTVARALVSELLENAELGSSSAPLEGHQRCREPFGLLRRPGPLTPPSLSAPAFRLPPSTPYIQHMAGMADDLTAITLVALGTSLPESRPQASAGVRMRPQAAVRHS